MVEFRDKSTEELAAWLPAMFAEYVNDRIGAGEDPDAARRNAASQHEQLFAEGRPAEGQHVMNIVDGERVVGTMWLGRPFSGASDTWYVFDIEVAEGSRGQGFGRAAMLAAEEWTREHGGARLGLNVFGPNVVARSLYESLGYQVLTTAMFKDVGPRSA